MQDEVTKIITRVLGISEPKNVDDFIKTYLVDIKLPSKVKSQFGPEGWTSVPGLSKYATQESVLSETSKHDWVYPSEDINSLKDLNKLIARADFMQSSRQYDSLNVKESDDVGKSENVYRSQNVIDSKNIFYCSWIWESEYLLGCTRSGNSTFCIGLVEGVNCSDSYRIYGSHKITKSMFIKSCYDMYECLFCSHMQHKKYCIANMQYDEETYFKLKKKIIGWLFD